MTGKKSIARLTSGQKTIQVQGLSLHVGAAGANPHASSKLQSAYKYQSPAYAKHEYGIVEKTMQQRSAEIGGDGAS